MPVVAEKMPKIDLHCHLDGSLDLEVTHKLLAERGEDYDFQEFRKLMQVDPDCQNLAEYLKRFDLPNHCLQDVEGIKTSAYHFAKNAALENVKYIEARFAPVQSMKQGLKPIEIIEAVEAGLAQARGEFDIETGMIICMMRGMDDEFNYSIAKAGREMLGAGVVACDIAGDEESYPMSQQMELFRAVKALDMPFTIHVGETGNAQNVRDAIDVGAVRLGHGIAMARNEELMKYCASRHVGVEICPTSNLQTKAYRHIKDCPICLFMEHGIPVSLNTDNRTVSNTNLSTEFDKVSVSFRLTDEQIHKIYTDSVEMSFASDDVKHRLLSKWR
ncbi:adenosine deaminase [Pseudobutyrivibrio sp.]|uniref:adenosine deaminase n=1 Tax=Pseudobutyrivibrio sp. TaxID=2014367 RepID=UPI00386D0EF8